MVKMHIIKTTTNNHKVHTHLNINVYYDDQRSQIYKLLTSTVVIEAYSPGYCTKNAKLGLEQ